MINLTVRDFLNSKKRQCDKELGEYTAKSMISDTATFMSATDEKTGLTNAAAITLLRRGYYQYKDWLETLPVEILEAEINEEKH